jgi:hypothetical protein
MAITVLRPLLAGVAALALLPAAALAQGTPAPAPKPAPVMRPAARPKTGVRGFLSANVGGLLTANDFSASGSFDVYQEKATYDTSYKVPSKMAFDIGGGVALWRHLGVAVAVTADQPKGDASLTGSVPHPFFLNKARSVSGTIPALQHSDTAVHVDAAWFAPVSPKLLVVAFGGPSFFSVKQDLVSGFRFTDVYPFDAATFESASVSSASTSVVGFNAGVDVTYRITRSFGVGGVLRFARATVSLSAGSTASTSIDVGGAIASAGVRWVF